MGKLLLWIVIGMIVMLVFRHFSSSARIRRDESRRRRMQEEQGARSPTYDPMVSCHVCGVHLPGSEALFARGRVYCSEAHMEQDRAARDGDKLK